ncbi:MAG TPA: hypothetical protein VNG51_26390 [Ktedonobacteraceae bacterium]|nr:hypothetical protein [Ktedonobacteraceae bacterium]
MRHLAAFLAATLLLGALFLSISLAGLPRSFAATGHNCAPPIPPPVPGALENPPATPGILFINELLLVPHSIWNCSETGGNFSTQDAWIELYNPQSQPFNLYAAHTYIDTGSSTDAFYLPFGTAIAAYGFLVLFPFYSPNFRPGPSMTFRLIIGTTVIDQVAVPTLGPDQSYARTSDGGPNWQITASPTIDASNGSPQSTPPATQGGGSSSGTPPASPEAIANGTQPAWNQLLLPLTPSTTTVPITRLNFTPTTLVTPGLSTTNGLDAIQRIGLTCIVILLILVLFACWKWQLYKFRS